MKQSAFFTLLLTCLPLYLHASPQALEFGIKLGRTGSQIDIKVEKKKEDYHTRFQRFMNRHLENKKKPQNEFETGGIAHYHAGIFFRRHLYKDIYIDWEILYTRKGGKSTSKEKLIFEPDTTILLESLTITFDYLLTSIHMTTFTNREKSYFKNLFFVLGPYLAYMLTAKESKVFRARSGERINTNVNLLDNASNVTLRRIDMGFIMGIGYEFDLGIILGSTFDVGLIRLLKDKRGTNLSAHFSMGYNFSKLYNN